MLQTEGIIRHRTLRRRQRKELIAEYRADMDRVQTHIGATTNKLKIKGLTNLYNILYRGYCELIDSEV